MLFDVGKVGGRPGQPLALFPYWGLFLPPHLTQGRRRVQVQLGPEIITLRARDHALLTAATAPGAEYQPPWLPWRRPMALKVFYGAVFGLVLGGLLAAALGSALSAPAGWVGFVAGVATGIWLMIRLFASREPGPHPGVTPPTPPGLPLY